MNYEKLKKTWEVLGGQDYIARLDLDKKELMINIVHPFIANYSDSYKNTTPIENIAITEILTEAHLYELGLQEQIINQIIKRRDLALRELTYSDKEGIPAVAQLLHDSLDNANGLEEAVYRSLNALGFETVKIGGNGKPDGYATAILGYDTEGNNRTYTLTYDAKSTSKDKISAATAKLSGLKRHQKDYNATYCIEVAIGYEGEEDTESAISKEAIQESVTVIKAKDLARLILYSIPNHLSLSKLQDLFISCHTPKEVTQWVDKFVKETPSRAPYNELIDIVYQFQKNDTEAPTAEVIRQKFKSDYNLSLSTSEVKQHLREISSLVPEQFRFDNNYAFLDVAPEILRYHINQAINNSSLLPMQSIYNELFSN